MARASIQPVHDFFNVFLQRHAILRSYILKNFSSYPQ